MKNIFEQSHDELMMTVRRLRRMLHHIGELVEPVESFERASGAALCPNCGLELRDHPEQRGATGVTVISCDGRRWKL
jgi:hypothetical protein